MLLDSFFRILMVETAEGRRVFQSLIGFLLASALVADDLIKRFSVLEACLIAWRIVEEVG
ncbi:hypothetical protein KAX06_07360 [candidate division WOR-3 bacterium]|nr:hypothetical protein [candidate division WOR-3 bacterium]